MSDHAKPKQTIKQLMPDPLKKLSIEAIEEAFSIALSELAKEGYEVDVHYLKLGTQIGHHDATMELSVRKKTFIGDNPFN